LSKYFKDTSSFKPDVLPRSGNRPGWQQGEDRREKQSFAVDKDPAKVDTPPPPPPPPQDEAVGAGDRMPSGNQGGPQKPQEPQVDLSAYMPLDQAQLEIDQAYLKGLEEGKAKVEEDYLAATRALLNACRELDGLRETLISNSSKELQDFALAIVERILRFSVQEQDHTIIATIEEALQRSVRSDEFTIYINPEDYQAVKEKSEELIAGITGLSNIVLKQDISIARGGAKLESENCTIDATVASQFDVIREEIRKRL
jgi:flagellar assembly protein FliH